MTNEKIEQLARMVWGAQVKRLPLDAAIRFAELVIAEQAETIEADAMRMLWDDQQLEEKEHYLAVARRAAMGTPAAAEPGKGEGK